MPLEKKRKLQIDKVADGKWTVGVISETFWVFLFVININYK